MDDGATHFVRMQLCEARPHPSRALAGSVPITRGARNEDAARPKTSRREFEGRLLVRAFGTRAFAVMHSAATIATADLDVIMIMVGWIDYFLCSLLVQATS